MRVFSGPATSSKIPALERAGFRELARFARPGDRLTVSELYRLCWDLADILALRVWCQQSPGLRETRDANTELAERVDTHAQVIHELNTEVNGLRTQTTLTDHIRLLHDHPNAPLNWFSLT